ncbi:MAG: DMT family transporter [Candidatus Limnocylindrales bacterium]
MLLGLIGVLCFSLTLPATRVAVAELDGTVVGLGRAIVAGLLAAALLVIRRERRPSRDQVRSLFVVGFGVVVGFPLLSALALTSVPAAHGAVVVGLLPLSTALMAVVRGRERPGGAFWLATAVGVGVVLVFGLTIGAGQLQPADLLLVGAVVAGGLGYAEGGRLAREMDGWRVICWALVLVAPLIVVPVGVAVASHGIAASAAAWLSFAYVSVVSMFLAFFAWYQGLAEGGIARVGQLQLLQPVLTLGWAVLLLHESVGLTTLAAALGIMATVAVGRRSVVRTVPATASPGGGVASASSGEA